MIQLSAYGFEIVSGNFQNNPEMQTATLRFSGNEYQIWKV